MNKFDNMQKIYLFNEQMIKKQGCSTQISGWAKKSFGVSKGQNWSVFTDVSTKSQAKGSSINDVTVLREGHIKVFVLKSLTIEEGHEKL